MGGTRGVYGGRGKAYTGFWIDVLGRELVKEIV